MTRAARIGNGDATAALVERITIRGVDDIREASVAIAATAASRGLRIAAYSNIASKVLMVDAGGANINKEIFGWVDETERWWEDAKLDQNSFGPRACRYESEPFWCNAAGIHLPWRNAYLDDVDAADFDQQRSYAAAIIVPVHLPFGQIGAVAFPGADLAKDDLSAEFAAHGLLLGALARRFISGYVTAMRPRQRIPSDCKLSNREIECLRWAAIGKTDGDIGEILSLSHATVRYHLHRAGDKLNAVNRSQTVFKAGQLGFLGSAS